MLGFLLIQGWEWKIPLRGRDGVSSVCSWRQTACPGNISSFVWTAHPLNMTHRRGLKDASVVSVRLKNPQKNLWKIATVCRLRKKFSGGNFSPILLPFCDAPGFWCGSWIINISIHVFGGLERVIVWNNDFLFRRFTTITRMTWRRLKLADSIQLNLHLMLWLSGKHLIRLQIVYIFIIHAFFSKST